MRSRSVLIVHREYLVADGLAAALARFHGLVPTAVATTAHSARRAAAGMDVVVLDARLPAAGEIAAEVRRGGSRLVFMGTPPTDDPGAWVSTSASLSELAHALAPAVQSRAQSLPDTLTRREQQILELVAKGLPGKQVARHLGISPKTVEQHKTRIFAKLGVSNQTAAVSRMLGGLDSRVAATGSGGGAAIA